MYPRDNYYKYYNRCVKNNSFLHTGRLRTIISHNARSIHRHAAGEPLRAGDALTVDLVEAGLAGAALDDAGVDPGAPVGGAVEAVRHARLAVVLAGRALRAVHHAGDVVVGAGAAQDAPAALCRVGERPHGAVGARGGAMAGVQPVGALRAHRAAGYGEGVWGAVGVQGLAVARAEAAAPHQQLARRALPAWHADAQG
eukprot:763690-Hanusia_phi.AAC.2